MTELNPRYQLYDDVENRPPGCGRGCPMHELGRREVGDPVTGTFLPNLHVHRMGTSIESWVYPNGWPDLWIVPSAADLKDLPPDVHESNRLQAHSDQFGSPSVRAKINLYTQVEIISGLKDGLKTITNGSKDINTLERHRFIDGAFALSTKPPFYTND